MGPVRDLTRNYEVVAGNGDQCIPGDRDQCGDGGPANQAKLFYPKGETHLPCMDNETCDLKHTSLTSVVNKFKKMNCNYHRPVGLVLYVLWYHKGKCKGRETCYRAA